MKFCGFVLLWFLERSQNQSAEFMSTLCNLTKLKVGLHEKLILHF